MSGRSVGYYRVKAGDEWLIGSYRGRGRWTVLLEDRCIQCYESGLDEIDESPIEIKPKAGNESQEDHQ